MSKTFAAAWVAYRTAIISGLLLEIYGVLYIICWTSVTIPRSSQLSSCFVRRKLFASRNRMFSRQMEAIVVFETCKCYSDIPKFKLGNIQSFEVFRATACEQKYLVNYKMPFTLTCINSQTGRKKCNTYINRKKPTAFHNAVQIIRQKSKPYLSDHTRVLNLF